MATTTTKPARSKAAAEKAAAEPVEAVEPDEAIEPDAIEPTELEEAIDREEEENDLLADMPALTDPKRLRIKHQNALMRISLKAAPVFQRMRATGREEVDPESIEGVFELTEDIDEFAEKIAVSPLEYAEWSAGKGANVFLAIFSRYMRARGE